MNTNKVLALSISACFCLSVAFNQAVCAKRPITITQRQEALQRDILKDQKSMELTKKEADGLRDDMSDIASRITKMKSKNGGKLSYADEGKVEKSLNDVSLKIKKLELKKRVESR